MEEEVLPQISVICYLNIPWQHWMPRKTLAVAVRAKSSDVSPSVLWTSHVFIRTYSQRWPWAPLKDGELMFDKPRMLFKNHCCDSIFRILKGSSDHMGKKKKYSVCWIMKKICFSFPSCESVCESNQRWQPTSYLDRKQTCEAAALITEPLY